MVKKKSKTPPANRRKTGGKLKNGLDPSVGAKTQFKPGESGNPSGRPPSLLSDAYKGLLEQVVEGDAKKRTYAQLIAEGQARAAVKGSTNAAKEIADRTEGKAKQSIEFSGKDGEPVSFNLNIRFVDENQPTPVRSQERK